MCGWKKPCQLRSNMNDACFFKSKHFDEIYKINFWFINFINLKNVAYLIEFRVSGEQCTGALWS